MPQQVHANRGATMITIQPNGITPKTTRQFLDRIFGADVHAKRIESLANATLGVISTASLAVNTIGHGLALARGKLTKHAIKQVDRLLSNPGIDVEQFSRQWVPYVVGPRQNITVAMDWTDFDPDNHATIMLSMVTRHGRATPLIWLTVDKDTLKNQRNNYEDQVLRQLADALPQGVKVLILADRGFGDQKLYRFLTEQLKFDYLIRFRGNINVTADDRETRPAADWVGPGGRSRTLRKVAVTADHYQVGTVVCVHAKDMKEPWCLAASTTSDTAKHLITTYGKRWSIEPGFRDTKDLRFGMGMGSIRVSDPKRRDRLWLLNAFAIALLTILGAAGEALGYDRHLKSNTAKHRTHSLFRQGAMLYDLIPKMPETRLRPLLERFEQMLRQIPVFAGVYGII
jgi:Transposase DDE domain